MLNGRGTKRHGNALAGTFMDGSAESMVANCATRNYIEHRVSKFDTLAGVAIKYGVEVADIKRMNGLATDLQMFALKTLRIPLPGRHLPSPILANGSANSGKNCNGHDRSCQPHIDVLESFQPLKQKSVQHNVSPAMSSLQGYYGLTPTRSKGAVEGTEMTVYRVGVSQRLDKEQLPKASPISDPPPTRHRKSRSLANGLVLENGDFMEDLLMREAGDGEIERLNEFPVRLHQKCSPDRRSPTPELILKEENTSGGFSGITGKGLAQRPKSASRAALAADADSGVLNPIPMADLTSAGDGAAGVRKSSSTSNLQASDNGPSIWSAPKWSLKTDLQSLSAASLARPIFDGLPKPITVRRNKAALD